MIVLVGTVKMSDRVVKKGWDYKGFDYINESKDIYNYIIPLIGDIKLDDVTLRLMNIFYQNLLKVKSKTFN